MDESAEAKLSFEQWKAARDVFISFADRYAKATRYEECSALADQAPKDMHRAMLQTVLKDTDNG